MDVKRKNFSPSAFIVERFSLISSRRERREERNVFSIDLKVKWSENLIGRNKREEKKGENRSLDFPFPLIFFDWSRFSTDKKKNLVNHRFEFTSVVIFVRRSFVFSPFQHEEKCPKREFSFHCFLFIDIRDDLWQSDQIFFNRSNIHQSFSSSSFSLLSFNEISQFFPRFLRPLIWSSSTTKMKKNFLLTKHFFSLRQLKSIRLTVPTNPRRF